MRVTALYFAGLRERAGRATSEEEVAPGTTVAALWESIRARPEFQGALAAPGFSVNGEWTRASRVLEAGDEVGFLPPVSGG